MKLIFVCHGNICRSTMAEFVMKDLVKKANLDDKISIISRATSTEEIGSDTHYGTKAILRANGIAFTTRAAKQITMDEFRDADYIVCMDGQNLKNLVRMFGESEKFYFLLDFTDENPHNPKSHKFIADPYYTGDFETTFDEVLAGCKGLLNFIK